MKEQRKTDWDISSKRPWVAPSIRRIPITDQLLTHFEPREARAPTRD